MVKHTQEFLLRKKRSKKSLFSSAMSKVLTSHSFRFVTFNVKRKLLYAYKIDISCSETIPGIQKDLRLKLVFLCVLLEWDGTQNDCWVGGQIRLLTAKMRLKFSKTSRKLKLSSATQTSGKVWGKMSFVQHMLNKYSVIEESSERARAHPLLVFDDTVTLKVGRDWPIRWVQQSCFFWNILLLPKLGWFQAQIS